MKKYSLIYYLLFILLVMGSFASMAQNSYGLKIMGGVGFVFGLLFFAEFISMLRKKGRKEVFVTIEPLCLFFLSVILALRLYYIHFSFVELLFTVAGVLLALIYLRKMIVNFQEIQPKNNLMAITIVIFHLAIILFFVSLVMVSFSQKISEIVGIVAFVLLLGFILTGLIRKDLMVDGEKMSSFRMITYFKDHSIIIGILFLLFSLYIGFNRIGLIPGIYSDKFPQAYFKLIDDVTKQKEKPVNGKYKYEDFMDKYRQFLKHNKIKDQ